MSAPRRKVAVYNRYWASYGGGERHAGMAAEVLAETGAEVDLIAHADLDAAAMGEHLGLDLSRCRVRAVPDTGDARLRALSGEYDLWVNGSYMSALPSQATKSIYICYFPTPVDHDLATWRKYAVRLLGPLVRTPPDATHLAWGEGWFPPEGGRRRRWTWTSGEASIGFAAGDPLEIRFDLGRPGQPPTDLTVSVDGSPLLVASAEPRFRPHRLAVPESDRPRDVHFTSDTFTPGGGDTRQLGVALSRIRFVGAGLGARERVAARFPWLLRDPRDLGFLDTYDVVLANSEYTAQWISRLWRHESEVLYPPVDVRQFRPAASRDRSIVSVGRFFPPSDGHSKRQLEQVHAFGRIVQSGRLAGWTLHLIGGCEKRSQGYLDEVRAAATGLPIEIHANAPRSLLENLLNTAAIQWSATGYGADEEKTPWASEHFGMTTVEAMAGGCVPIVIDKAGQREIVRHGVDGFRWSTLEQLIEQTIDVATAETLRARLAASAIQRAQNYSDEAFADGLRDVVKRKMLS